MRLQISSKHATGQGGLSAFALNNSNDCDAIFSWQDKSLTHINRKTFHTQFDPIFVGYLVTSLSWQPSAYNKYSKDESRLAAACSDGSLILYKPNRVGQNCSMKGKKRIIAHEGSVLSVRWSPDGTSLASSGGDGEVKIWSQTGHLRCTIARFDCSVNCLAWNSTSCSVVSAHGTNLSVHHIQDQGDHKEWQVSSGDSRNGVVLAVDWNSKSDLIVCGGEDAMYRVYNSLGISLFTSEAMSYPVTSVAWMPNGESFAIGSFETIRFCSKGGGCSKCYDINTKSSVVGMEWTKDSSQIFAACSSGIILVADVIGKVLEWNGVSAELVDACQLSLRFMKNNTCEIIQTHSGPVIDFKLGFEHLVIFTRTQCQIYSLWNLKSPVTFDIDKLSRLICLSHEHFAILGNDGIIVYSYSGRKISSIRYEGNGINSLVENLVSMSKNILAFVDPSNRKIIKLYDCVKGKSFDRGAQIENETDIQCIGLSHFGTNEIGPGTMAFLDKNKDLYVVCFERGKSSVVTTHPSTYKIGTQVDSMLWNETSGALSSITESKFVIYHHPGVPFIDVDLISDIKETLDIDACEKAQLISFRGARICARRNDNVVIETLLTQDASLLFTNTAIRKWKESLRYCHFVDSTQMWATLVCLALTYDNLEFAEIALMAIKKVDKVEQIKHIRNIQNIQRKNAEMQLYKRNIPEAIAILLQSQPPSTYRAIKILVHMFLWDEALQVATRSEEEGFVDLVLWYRSKKLRQMEKKETNSKFKSLLQKRSVISDETASNLKSKWRITE